LRQQRENQEETAAKLKMGIKSIMTDRHVVNKAYKKMLENEKLKAIEEIEGTNKTEEDKKEMAHSVSSLCLGQNMRFNGNDGGQGFLWQPVNFNISQVFKY
jgi:hypothetical protein